ncbi:MAG: acetamidase/formamidase family protein [Gammaproteobacteria bacterium]|nr:acetamidase/formamidase family protein [Gammaproteobacteria bacterium]
MAGDRALRPAVGVQLQLDDAVVHYAWDNAVAPRLTVDPGDTVCFDTRDSADGWYGPDSSDADVLAKGPLTGHPLTGPVRVRGAEPGDVLAVEVLAVEPRAGFGWTAIRPGRGLLPETEFAQAFLQIWTLGADGLARMRRREDIAVPVAAFPGILGTGLAERGAHSTIPPRHNGGNMDLKHLTAGSTLYLPVFVDGALFSVGDAHAAQGDGEVCVTAIEMAARVTLRLNLLPGDAIAEPRLRTPVAPGTHGAAGPYYATTAHGPDLYECAQRAVRYLIEHLVRERGLSREQAYVLCSVCADLKINEIVDRPNWLVSAFLPEGVFTA